MNDPDSRPSPRVKWHTIAVAVVLIYVFSYLVARQFLGLRIHGGALDSDEWIFRSFLPGAALNGLNTIYLPLLLAGLIGCLRNKNWGNLSLAAALGITIYWPIVSLAALVEARDAPGWKIASEVPYWFVCLLVAAWGVWGLWQLLRHPKTDGDDS